MKKHASLALLSLSLILASCGGAQESTPATSSQAPVDSDTSVNSQSENPSTPGADSSAPAASSSSAPAVETKDVKIKKLLTKMGTTVNCTIGSTSGRSYYVLNEKTVLVLFADSEKQSGEAEGFGFTTLDAYGLVQFNYQNSTAGVTDASVVSPVKTVTVNDLTYTCKDLAEAVPEDLELVKMKSGLWYTDNTEFAATLALIDGVSANDLSHYRTVTAALDIDDNGTTITASYSLSNPTSTDYKAITKNGLTIGSIGVTTNAAVTRYINSNPTFAAATAWDSYTSQYLAAALPGVTLPLPNGRTYCYEMWDGESATIYTDYGCGNITAAYKTQIEALGFTMDADQSEPTEKFYVYKKLATPAQGLQGAIYNVVIFYHEDVDSPMYPYGLFSIMAGQIQDAASVDPAALDQAISNVKLANGSRAFPTFTVPTGFTKIEVDDMTQEAQDYYDEENDYYNSLFAAYGYDVVYTTEVGIYTIFDIYYPTLAEAQAAESSYTSALVAAGFQASTTQGVYYIQQGDWTYQVSFETLDDDGAYLGYLEIFFGAMSETVTGADADMFG